MKHLLFTLLLVVTSLGFSQSISEDFKSALKADDSIVFSKLLTDNNINACYEAGSSSYSLLALTIKLVAKQCFDALLKNKVSLEKACAGKTPIMYAVKYGHIDMVKALVEAGANHKAENGSGRTALDYSMKYEQKEIFNYLKEL